ncbi:hypothetical protein ACJIZ3_021842 [Penstemon smallii]|uniref:Myb/SANT-like DNA-binding domain-containing protein n=1 Tax=Penstemon smallii TaxID=265156 RepID=A0ABD3SN98_9LAMI
MDSNAMSGGIYSNVQPGMLGLEMSLHHHIPQPQPPHQIPQQNQQHPHHPMVAFAHLETDNYHPHPQTQQSLKQDYPFAPKSKNQSLTLSDEDEPGFTAENSTDDGNCNKKTSPWHRMKWTDNMVRLLIMVVFYIGDEVGSEVNNNDPSHNKKKSGGGGGGGGGGVLQKKGKWKSVSKAMMERGFYVSPQQCEDKFNDLNKRYKRVNDIIGKGTACRVVENQSLLESMDHISPKMKEEVKKLLNSKHLFFREMCAYHNSCGHGGGPSGGGAANGGAQLSPAEPQPAKPTSDSDNDDDNDEDEDNDDDEDNSGNESIDERTSRKRVKRGSISTSNSGVIQKFDGELMNLMSDGTKSAIEKRQWMKTKLMGLEEERVGIQSQAFELEKQRLKWLKFSTKKEREMERGKLANEKLKLENERMVLLLRQKELDLLDHFQQQSNNKRNEPSFFTG